MVKRSYIKKWLIYHIGLPLLFSLLLSVIDAGIIAHRYEFSSGGHLTLHEMQTVTYSQAIELQKIRDKPSPWYRIVFVAFIDTQYYLTFPKYFVFLFLFSFLRPRCLRS